MRGVRDSEYEGGLYHLRILLPPNYPMAAPDIMLMTPNGRFELGKKANLSFPSFAEYSSCLTDLHRWSDKLSRWIVAARLGSQNRWVICLHVMASGAKEFVSSHYWPSELLDARWRSPLRHRCSGLS